MVSKTKTMEKVIITTQAAIKHIDDNDCAGAKTMLTGLVKRLSGTQVKRPAGKYALFMKANYGKIAKANPNMPPPDIMQKVALEWNKQK